MRWKTAPSRQVSSESIGQEGKDLQHCVEDQFCFSTYAECCER